MRVPTACAVLIALGATTLPALAENACVTRYHHRAGTLAERPLPSPRPWSGALPSQHERGARVAQGVAPVAPIPRSASPSPSAPDAAAQFHARAPYGFNTPLPGSAPAYGSNDRYPEHPASKPQRTAENPVSTFGADVDTASYTILQRHVREGRPIPTDGVRVEELINAFDYGYPAPETVEAGFRPEVEVVPSPWSEGRKLLRIGVKAFEVPRERRPKVNLVVLMDVSGSMASLDRLPLAKTSVCLLLDELRPDDSVAIVTYAGATRVALGPTAAGEKAKVLDVLDRLEAGGSTAGASGIDLAYAQAAQAFVPGGVNRVLIATDGDFNVGISDPRRLKDLIERKRKDGVTLTVLGYGMGNHKDTTMQTLAEAGNGQAAYIGTVADARRAFARGVGGNLFTVATDTKFQVELNPARVAEWRLVGYESRRLDRADFDNDRVDAGDVGAGQSVTVLYELVPTGAQGDVPTLRYGSEQPREPAGSERGEEVAFLKIRYKPAGSDTSRLLEMPVDASREVADLAQASEATRFVVAVAWIGQMLKRDPAVDEGGYARAIDLAKGAVGADLHGDRIAFVDFAHKAKPGM